MRGRWRTWSFGTSDWSWASLDLPSQVKSWEPGLRTLGPLVGTTGSQTGSWLCQELLLLSQ